MFFYFDDQNTDSNIEMSEWAPFINAETPDFANVTRRRLRVVRHARDSFEIRRPQDIARQSSSEEVNSVEEIPIDGEAIDNLINTNVLRVAPMSRPLETTAPTQRPSEAVARMSRARNSRRAPSSSPSNSSSSSSGINREGRLDEHRWDHVPNYAPRWATSSEESIVTRARLAVRNLRNDDDELDRLESWRIFCIRLGIAVAVFTFLVVVSYDYEEKPKQQKITVNVFC